MEYISKPLFPIDDGRAFLSLQYELSRICPVQIQLCSEKITELNMYQMRYSL